MEDCHEGICEGKTLEVAALWAAIRVPVTEVRHSGRSIFVISVGSSISSPQ